MTSGEPTQTVRRAVAALALVRLAEDQGFELDQVGTSGIYVCTVRGPGAAVHVLAGSPDELLERVRQLA